MSKKKKQYEKTKREELKPWQEKVLNNKTTMPPLYYDKLEPVFDMTDEEAGILFKILIMSSYNYLRNYEVYDEIPSFKTQDRFLKNIVPQIQNTWERDSVQYAISNGGNPETLKQNQKKTEDIKKAPAEEEQRAEEKRNLIDEDNMSDIFPNATPIYEDDNLPYC